MIATCEQWKRGHSPVTEGLFYPDDSFRSAWLDRGSRLLSIGERQTLPSDVAFVDLGSYESGRLQCPFGIIRWGGGPWEGEGWIALEDASGDLAWLLHLEDSEPFTQARFESDIIEAVAYEYPQMTVFKIPVLAPHETTSTTEPDA
jgi:hypothetical protein